MSGEIQTWYAVDIVTERSAAEAAEVALNALDCLGIEIDSLRREESDERTVTGFFETRQDEAAVREAVDDALTIYGIGASAIHSVTTREVVQTDWLAEWKKHWRPTEAGKFVISAPWHEPAGGDHIDIRIEPNMAFGTGTHETTRLCLEAVGELLREGDSFLDVGTGTGILAIAAAKLGASQITACDTDRDSVAIARENAELNGVGGDIDLFEGAISGETGPADVVAANLTLDVIEPILPQLVMLTGRCLILSGILVEQRPQIETALGRLGQHSYDIRQQGEWISVAVGKNGLTV